MKTDLLGATFTIEQVAYSGCTPSSGTQLTAVVDRDWIEAVAGIGEDKSEATAKDTLQSLTPAQKLSESVHADLIPIDDTVRQMFGFSKVNNPEEESCLLGLYIGLMRLLPNPPTAETIQTWVTRNKLAGGIHHTYKSQKGESDYFKWFKKNRHFFDQNYRNPNGSRAPAKNGTPLDKEIFDKLTGQR